MERAHRLGVRIDFQNVFMWDKAATVERFLGRAVAARAVPTKTLINKVGIDSLGAGTDFPVNPINPLLNMYIMVTRKDPNGNVYGASEAIGREQALRLYTSAATRYTFEEGRKGTLEPGKLADLVVLSADYVAVPEDQIKDIKADVTIVGGKIVFQRCAAAPVSETITIEGIGTWANARFAPEAADREHTRGQCLNAQSALKSFA